MTAAGTLPNKPALMNEIESALSALLENEGFDSKATKRKTEQRDFVEWTRDLGWKQDIVKIGRRPRGLKIGLGLEVRMPTEPETLDLFDGRRANDVLGRRGYLIPSGTGRLARWRTRALVGRIRKDCGDALTWFEQSSSPRVALERLRTGETNGCGSGGKVFSRVERHLESLGADSARSRSSSTSGTPGT